MKDISERVMLFERELDSLLQKYHLTMNIATQFPTKELPKLVELGLELANSYGVTYKPVYTEKKD